MKSVPCGVAVRLGVSVTLFVTGMVACSASSDGPDLEQGIIATGPGTSGIDMRNVDIIPNGGDEDAQSGVDVEDVVLEIGHAHVRDEDTTVAADRVAAGRGVQSAGAHEPLSPGR